MNKKTVSIAAVVISITILFNACGEAKKENTDQGNTLS